MYFNYWDKCTSLRATFKLFLRTTKFFPDLIAYFFAWRGLRMEGYPESKIWSHPVSGKNQMDTKW